MRMILSLICCLLFIHVEGQDALVSKQYFFKSLSVRNGLSQNTVNAILQDHLGFMWFGTKDGLNRYDGTSFRVFKHCDTVSHINGLGNSFITALYEDANGDIWVGTDAGLYVYKPKQDVFQDMSLMCKGSKIEHKVTIIVGDKFGCVWVAVESQGLYCYNSKEQTFHYYSLKSFPELTTNVEALAFDELGTLWVGCYGDGLFYSADRLKTLHPYTEVDSHEKVFANDIVFSITKGSYNCLYIASLKKGLQELNLTTGKLKRLMDKDEHGDDLFCRKVLVSKEGTLWLGTENGAYVYDLSTGHYVHLQNSPSDPYSLSDNAIYSLCQDSEGGIWIGSYFGGVNYFPKSYSYFEKYYPTGKSDGLHGKRVREFCQDKQGVLWIGTEDGGLNRFDPRTKQFKFFEPSSSFTNVHGLCMVGDKLWVGTFAKGVRVIDTKTGKVIKTFQKRPSSHTLIDNSIFAIEHTSTGDILLGTMFGLLRYKSEIDGFETILELEGKFIYDIKEDSKGNIWLATYADGAYCFDVREKKWKQYRHKKNDLHSLPYDKVISLFEDSKHQIWLTTQGGGFCKFLADTETFENYGAKDGLPNEVVYQIVEDDDGLFWLTTNSGMVRFCPETHAMRTFTTSNGLLGDQFNYCSGFRTQEGTIYLGSIDGFIAFNPQRFVENDYQPSLVMTDFYLFGKEVTVSLTDSPLKQNIVYTKNMELTARQNSFGFRVSALDFQNLKSNKIVYKLDGVDKDWRDLLDNSIISYANIKHGNYVFRAKVAHGDGTKSENEIALHIVVLPPFYLTIWAYILYVVIGLCLLFYMIYRLRRRNLQKYRRQMELFEQQKEREIYDAKIDFFTNVAHEIRTPLTLINGPLENILLKNHVDSEIRDDLYIMKQNTERLINLVNQLLDFRKAESRTFKLNFTSCNISELLRETYQRFSSLAKQRGLDFNIVQSETDFFAHVNKEAFIKIVSNLLNNAVKYAEHYVCISLEIEADVFHIKTLNDGPNVPDDMKDQIFKPFVRYSVDNSVSTGTGIGLSLARSLAELHQGNLVMEKACEYNCFRLTLPVKHDNTLQLSAEFVPSDVEKSSTDTSELNANQAKPTVLIVEDNVDMQSFIVRQLGELYIVLTANNGQEALECLDGNWVSLVISDVMMPVMDGFELCKTMKSQLNYSHIPVILLTAKTDLRSRIEGVELGADVYIDKPFSVEYLRACVANLLQNRENLRRAFARSPFVAANTMALTKADDEFIKMLDEVIQANLKNAEFSMDDMADQMNMSRSNFYRKIKGVLDLTPNEYLRLERLKKAAQLLREGEKRINEICYRVGFNSPSYFSKCFYKQFGVTPKDFAEQS